MGRKTSVVRILRSVERLYRKLPDKQKRQIARTVRRVVDRTVRLLKRRGN